MFAQVDTAATAVSAASSILEGRSESLVILVLFVAAGLLWVWKVTLPRMDSDRKLREADKEIQKTNSETLQKLTDVTSTIHRTTSKSSHTMSAFLEIKKIEVDCIENVATKVGCDLIKPLSEIRGVLKAIEAGSTSGD